MSPAGVNFHLINEAYSAPPSMPKAVGIFPGIPAVCVSFLVKSLVSVLPMGGGICFIINIWEFFMASWMQGPCQICVLQRFSPCLWLIFILLPVSFTEQMFLCWWSTSYEFFSSMDRIIGVRSKKAWPFQAHKDFPPSSRSFIILCFILKSMLYLDSWEFRGSFSCL